MKVKRTYRKLNAQEQRVRDWIRENRGILTQIAVKVQCCHQFVQQVAYGRSTTYKAHLVIEDELRAAGWPGIMRVRDKRDRRTREILGIGRYGK